MSRRARARSRTNAVTASTGLLVESGSETAQHLHVAEQAGWFDPAVGAIRSAADATALTRPDSLSSPVARAPRPTPDPGVSRRPRPCPLPRQSGLWCRGGGRLVRPRCFAALMKRTMSSMGQAPIEFSGGMGRYPTFRSPRFLATSLLVQEPCRSDRARNGADHQFSREFDAQELAVWLGRCSCSRQLVCSEGVRPDRTLA